MPYVLQKWDIIRVFRPDYRNAHDKFCICICPKRNWFLYINSDPPNARKKRIHAISVASWEVLCLTKPQSWIDTATLISDLPSDQLTIALTDINRQHGPLTPALRDRIRMAVNTHGTFTQEQTEAVLID